MKTTGNEIILHECKGGPGGLAANSGGFTLVEVLVTLLIMSISLAAIFQSFSASTKISMKTSDLLEAERIANNLFLYNELMEETKDSDDQAGDVKDNPEWEYELKARDIDINETTTTYNDKGEVEDQEIESYEFKGMREVTLCLKRKNTMNQKTYCISRWY